MCHHSSSWRQSATTWIMIYWWLLFWQSALELLWRRSCLKHFEFHLKIQQTNHWQKFTWNQLYQQEVAFFFSHHSSLAMVVSPISCFLIFVLGIAIIFLFGRRHHFLSKRFFFLWESFTPLISQKLKSQIHSFIFGRKKNCSQRPFFAFSPL